MDLEQVVPVDGCSRVELLWGMVPPLAAPAVVAVVTWAVLLPAPGKAPVEFESGHIPDAVEFPICAGASVPKRETGSSVNCCPDRAGGGRY